MAEIIVISISINIVFIFATIYNWYNRRCYIEELYAVLKGDQSSTSIEYDKVSLDFGERLGSVIRQKNKEIQHKTIIIEEYEKLLEAYKKDASLLHKIYADLTKHKRQR